MFAYDWAKGGPWDSRGIVGSRRFIEDVWKLATARYESSSSEGDADLRRSVHQTIQKVGADLESFDWNTAVAALMSLRNEMQQARRLGTVSEAVWEEAVRTLLLLLAPIAPHVTEELWREALGNEESIHIQAWPEADPEVAAEETVTLVVQVNGKVRDRVQVAPDITEEAAVEAAMSAERVQEWLTGGEVRTVIARPPNLVNIVVS
jgi:leucyl-tRNA synthetase